MKYITRNTVYKGFKIKENNTEYLLMDLGYKIIKIFNKSDTSLKNVKRYIDKKYS